MNHIQIKLEGTSLASRAKAAHFRQAIETPLRDEQSVALDLTSIESISDSYADELFGVLALRYGLQTLTDHVKVIGASDDIMLVIAQCIFNRVNPTQHCVTGTA